jgi:hypothetical protein
MGAAALCFAGAITMFVLPKPRAGAVDTKVAEAPPAPPPKPPKNPAEGIRTDWPTLTAAVDGLNSPEIAAFKEELRRRRDEAMAAEVTGGSEEQQKTAGGFAPPWRFLGLIVEPTGFAALVEIDQKHRFVRAGYQSTDGYEVVSVAPDRLVVRKGRSEYTIRREESNRGRALAAGAVMPSMPGMNKPQMDPTGADETADLAEMRRRRAQQQGDQP